MLLEYNNSADKELHQLKKEVNSIEDDGSLQKKLESSITSYNNLCFSLLGNTYNIISKFESLIIIYLDLRTKYESSILLWQQFLLKTDDFQEWMKQANNKSLEIQTREMTLEMKSEQIRVSFIKIFYEFTFMKITHGLGLICYYKD